MIKRWSQYIGAVAALVLVSGLIAVLLIVGANLIQSFSINALRQAAWSNQRTVQATYTARTILNAYYVLAGIAFLGLFFLMENQLVTTGVPKKLVLRRTFFALGVELLILALMQLAMMAYVPALPLQIGLAVLEILLGVGLIYLGQRKTPISSV